MTATLALHDLVHRFYEQMLERVRDTLHEAEEATPKLRAMLDKARDHMVELGELTREEINSQWSPAFDVEVGFRSGLTASMPKVIDGKLVVMEDILKMFSAVTWIDHHETAIHDLASIAPLMGGIREDRRPLPPCPIVRMMR